MLAVLFTATAAVVPATPGGCVPPAGIRQVANDECVGVTDGSFIFNSRLIKIEQRIKALNDQVTASGKPYVTIVYLGPLTAPPTTRPQQDLLASAQGELVGLSIAQQNRNRSGTPLGVRILLANTGSKMRYAQQVAQQIRTRTLDDQHIVGVVGFEQSRQQTQQAIADIAQAGLPMIGTANSYDNTAYQGSSFSPFYFRVAPPNSRVAVHAAYWARSGLTGVHARTVTVVFDGDPADLYSKNLADDFSHDFGPKNVTELSYTRPGDVPNLVARACEHPPDLFYYVGRSAEFGAFRNQLTNSTCGNGRPRTILADDEIAEYVNDHATDIGSNDAIRLYYTPLALREAWTRQQVGDQPVPRFFNDYHTIVGPNPPPDIRPSLTHAAVSYDATLIFTSVTAKLFDDQQAQPTPAAVLAALIEPKHLTPLQGASGWLSFSSSDTGHQVHDKPVLLATVRPNGAQEVLAVCGHLVPRSQGHSNCPPQDR